ncbi:MAG: hypothetical protein MK165_13090, partial [Pirellulaceae bacterium]|nr:hypothetical protein [Pirellulaceae bacterium]
TLSRVQLFFPLGNLRLEVQKRFFRPLFFFTADFLSSSVPRNCETLPYLSSQAPFTDIMVQEKHGNMPPSINPVFQLR